MRHTYCQRSVSRLVTCTNPDTSQTAEGVRCHLFLRNHIADRYVPICTLHSSFKFSPWLRGSHRVRPSAIHRLLSWSSAHTPSVDRRSTGRVGARLVGDIFDRFNPGPGSSGRRRPQTKRCRVGRAAHVRAGPCLDTRPWHRPCRSTRSCC